MGAFHQKHGDIALLLNVTRHPYSFIADSRGTDGSDGSLVGANCPEGREPTWHESLLGYCGGDAARRREAEEVMRDLGRRVGIELDYNVKTQWQPVDSQRLMLWSHRFGKQEAFMSALGRRHFEERTSASHRATLLEAVGEAGLDVHQAEAFLQSGELAADVWRSYRTTIRDKGIHAIPLFIFNSPLTDGGPFRTGSGRPYVVNGSSDQAEFLGIFERILRDVEGASAEQPERMSPM